VQCSVPQTAQFDGVRVALAKSGREPSAARLLVDPAANNRSSHPRDHCSIRPSLALIPTFNLFAIAI
jgi:hypothetical protein